MHEVDSAIMDSVLVYGTPASSHLRRRTQNPIRCYVGRWEVELRYANVHKTLEFPRPGRGDEVTYSGTTVINFYVSPEIQPHVPEWAEQSDELKLRAGLMAILGLPNHQVTYEFLPEEEIKRTLQWPYTWAEVSFQMNALKHAD